MAFPAPTTPPLWPRFIPYESCNVSRGRPRRRTRALAVQKLSSPGFSESTTPQASPSKPTGREPVQRLLVQFQTTTEAAERLGFSRVTICRWCRQGRFPGALKFARAWYIPRGDPREAADFPFETTTDAAERLGVSVPYVIKLIERGHLAGERGPWRSFAVARGAVPREA